MKVAILSDVHANIDALRVVLDDVARTGASTIACLGDSVGYGAEPSACLDLLFESCEVMLAGNHDLAATGRLDSGRFSEFARHAVGYARDLLTPAQRARLATLPDEDWFGELLFVHASPAKPTEFPYIRDAESARDQFDGRSFRVAFYGHTHVPLAFHDDGERVVLSQQPQLRLAADRRHLCNVGSVGQPRDQDPRACYALFDTDSSTLSFRRIEYDVEAAAARVRAAGLPEPLGARLLVGV
jgi:diadenosine tetraphosphatase ApaH/serine/threonine PP2A family protein phosphatase